MIYTLTILLATFTFPILLTAKTPLDPREKLEAGSEHSLEVEEQSLSGESENENRSSEEE